MKRLLGLLVLSLVVLSWGCKKEAPPPDPAGEESAGAAVETTGRGSTVNVQTEEGEARVTTNEDGTEVKVETKEGSAKITTDDDGETVKVQAPGQPGINITRDKKGGRVRVNVGGLNIDVPDHGE